MTIREEASAILKLRIEPGQWKQMMNRLDIQGAFTRKHERDFLIMLCEHVEKLESAIATLIAPPPPQPPTPLEESLTQEAKDATTIPEK